MIPKKVDVLLIGDSAGKASNLHDHLRRYGCFLQYATSCKEAEELLKTRAFDLVLSKFMLSDGTAYQFMPLLRGSQTTMFFSNAVEDGCWWMNAIFRGEDRSHEPGMRPAEFRVRLDQILYDKLFPDREELSTTHENNEQADFQALNNVSPHTSSLPMRE